MPTSQFPVPQYSYDQTPVAQAGPFSQYIQGNQGYQDYMNRQRSPVAPSGPGVAAHYITSFMEGLQGARAKAMVEQHANETAIAQKVNDYFKGLEQQGYDPADIAKLRQYFESQHTGWNLQNLAKHGKQNPLAKAFHGVLDAMAGGGRVDQKTMIDPVTGKPQKYQYGDPSVAFGSVQEGVAGVHDLDAMGNGVLMAHNGGPNPLRTMQQKQIDWMRGTQEDGSDGFGARMAKAIADYRDKNGLGSTWQPTQEEFRTLISPTLAQEADTNALRFNIQHPMSWMQTNVPRTAQSDTVSQHLNSYNGDSILRTQNGSTPPPTAPVIPAQVDYKNSFAPQQPVTSVAPVQQPEALTPGTVIPIGGKPHMVTDYGGTVPIVGQQLP